MNSINHIYCIHLKDRIDRECMINETAKKHNIIITFIDAITPNDQIVMDKLNQRYDSNKITNYMKKEYACVLSHLKAIQEIISNNDKFAIIIEDDAQFILNFNYIINQVLEIWNKEEYSIIHLSPFISSRTGMKPISFQDCDICIDDINLEFFTTNNQTWSATGYLVSNEGACKIINSMDERFEKLKYITSETFIIQQNETCLCIPPLIVESCITSSSIQPAESNEYHIRYWNKYRKDHTYI